MYSEFNPSHKYIQQCPECGQVHETQRHSDEYCIQCKQNDSLGSPAA